MVPEAGFEGSAHAGTPDQVQVPVRLLGGGQQGRRAGSARMIRGQSARLVEAPDGVAVEAAFPLGAFFSAAGFACHARSPSVITAVSLSVTARRSIRASSVFADRGPAMRRNATSGVPALR